MEPEERNRLLRAAALRPMNLLPLVLGLGVFATSRLWWILPLTLATYAALVCLSYRDPLFRRRVLSQGSGAPDRLPPPPPREVSPERRARWLPRGETRRRVEEALEVYHRVVLAIEEADETTRELLDDALPKLHTAAERLVEVAERREKAAGAAREIRESASPSAEGLEEARRLEERIGEADAEISNLSQRFLTLRAQVVRASIDSSGSPEKAAGINASLDELNLRLAALERLMRTSEGPPGAKE
ncbi:hypothetical protein Rxyl_0790 [Rubrobacter xylanophilus DSM 9941]|uniref:Uncharacterized protein n=1 Tax=Rubrobacter xylanophilus (strain DSM 9941 / JCM 11954 / NBRC 16129 / PRD-1) TaxID=266117 RepID=Q1AXX0_RUBXD|nr:hypothetical protein [Rubrobacter xylanophilus]ABG03758.1 hypothetical protein Rxyl_0790 [Rubrobacter xylanophilus DSM 9941]